MFSVHCCQFTHTIEKMSQYCRKHHWGIAQWCVSKHKLTYGNDAFTELFHLPSDLVVNESNEADKHNDEEVADSESLH
ncbi:hypothetical protein [uncultured Shewanella sp.]|uniref:hypothetical protein n=1 Tax=uncultured Shewanella sp. TaxID=173975 RepID=UPI0026256DDF|nr:hypothetical protein [uncultured Shewanella sp.]